MPEGCCGVISEMRRMRLRWLYSRMVVAALSSSEGTRLLLLTAGDLQVGEEKLCQAAQGIDCG